MWAVATMLESSILDTLYIYVECMKTTCWIGVWFTTYVSRRRSLLSSVHILSFFVANSSCLQPSKDCLGYQSYLAKNRVLGISKHFLCLLYSGRDDMYILWRTDVKMEKSNSLVSTQGKPRWNLQSWVSCKIRGQGCQY